MRKKDRYDTADLDEAGFDPNYGPMEQLFSVVIERTLQIHGASCGERA